MKHIFIDPSGNFDTGKGHTGIATIEDNDDGELQWDTLIVSSIAAADYTSRHEYWKAVAKCLYEPGVSSDNTIVIIESFLIRTDGILMGSMPETILLIGALVHQLEELKIPYTFQAPSTAKSRFKDHMLPYLIPGMTYNGSTHRYYLNGKCINDHIRDALKHLLYFQKYRKIKHS